MPQSAGNSPSACHGKVCSADNQHCLHAPVGAASYALGWDNDTSQLWSSDALAKAGACPILTAGGSVEVAETIDM